MVRPRSWKDLIGSWRTIVRGGTSGAEPSTIKAEAEPASSVRATVRDRSPSGDRVDLSFVTDDDETFWSVSVIGSERLMSLHGTWRVTNAGEATASLVKFRFPDFDAEHPMVWTAATVDGRKTVSANNMLPGGTTTTVQGHCFLRCPDSESTQAFVADVVFTDSLGGEHPIRAVRFAHLGP
jgi:hypothetical protein